MYYSDELKPKVYDYTKLSEYNHLPKGAIVIVENPTPHKWMRAIDGWVNITNYNYMNEPPIYFIPDIKIETNNKENYWKSVKEYFKNLFK